MANVANARVVTGRATVSARVSRGAITVSANTPVDENTVGASVQQPQRNASANVQTRNNTVQAQMPMGGTTDHSHLRNLDYEHSGHTGFQKELTEENAGEGIDITDGVISCTVNGAEWGNITGDIADQVDLTNALNSKQDALTAGTGITINENNVISNDVSPLVPAQATVNNQLADKDFVNSSIATSTATFRETYNVVTDLHLSTSAKHQQVATALGTIISVADNNDYCFVEIPTSDLTPTETLQVDRYKYNGSSWSFEYTLNNSGYTSAQWKAINSGITSGKVTQYDDYATSKQDTLTAGSGISLQNGNINTQNIIWRAW